MPNLTLGAPIVKCLRGHCKAFFDVHMMVSKPEQWVEDFAKAGANSYTFHVEAASDSAALIKKIRDAKMRVGITLKPGTPLSAIEPFVSSVDMVLVMTVEPGFGGQSFMADQLDKVRSLRKQYPHLDIEVDGGIGPDTVQQAAEAGANVLVSGSAIFKSKDMKATIHTLREAVDKVINKE